MFNRIKEYAKLIPKAITNFDNITEGAINALLFRHNRLPDDEMDEIKRRRKICDGCPFLSSNAVSNPAINYKTDRFDEHCILCGCPKETKTASLNSNCGIESFNETSPDSKMELKWTSYNKTKEDDKTN